MPHVLFQAPTSPEADKEKKTKEQNERVMLMLDRAGDAGQVMVSASDIAIAIAV